MTSTDLPLEKLVDRIIAAADAQTSAELNDDLRDALNEIAGHPDRGEARAPIACRLGDVRSCAGAGYLAVWLGAGAEHGEEPEEAGQQILETMLKWSRAVHTSDDEVDSDESGDDEINPDTDFGLERLGQGLVAHVARSMSLHQHMMNRPDVIAEFQRTEHLSSGPMWVMELLRKQSGHLVVIHVESKRVVRVAYQNLSNCFHLFTLLQSALADIRMPGSKRVSAHLKSVALGQRHDEASDKAWWHYGVGTCAKADFAGSIWGEATPDSIPEIDAEQVVLLWPMLLASRQWGAGFFGPFLQALPPSVTVQGELSEEEATVWFERLKLPEIKTKPWWKLW
ncbi:hypothetical protein [Stieleria varia]|uniref:Uncharacterized protein n=1 Tax=Stieleria varia TaxID=2528005 RepID=A0A5C6B9F8_9BACT|nr:hypothetical protein [Stieleria varia]TWU08071.1 hypothetical protein Pla52n_06520 [Stieleria varia]